MQKDYHVYVMVREDLTPEQQAVQAGHAVLEMTRTCSPDLTIHPSMVYIGIKDEKRLKNLINKLTTHGKIPFAIFREPYRNNEYTAIATVPLSGTDRDFFKNYQLLKMKVQK